MAVGGDWDPWASEGVTVKPEGGHMGYRQDDSLVGVAVLVKESGEAAAPRSVDPSGRYSSRRLLEIVRLKACKSHAE